MFIPLASNLFEIFESSDLKSSGAPSTLKPLDMVLNIKAPSAYLGTRVYATGLVEECVNLLVDWYDCFADSVGFPELAVPGIIQVTFVFA